MLSMDAGVVGEKARQQLMNSTELGLDRALNALGQDRLLESPTLLRGLLLDYAKGEHRGYIFVLVAALNENVPRRLLAMDRSNSTSIRMQLMDHLVQTCAFKRSAAEWAVDIWIDALGLRGLLPLQSVPVNVGGRAKKGATHWAVYTVIGGMMIAMGVIFMWIRVAGDAGQPIPDYSAVQTSNLTKAVDDGSERIQTSSTFRCTTVLPPSQTVGLTLNKGDNCLDSIGLVVRLQAGNRQLAARRTGACEEFVTFATGSGGKATVIVLTNVAGLYSLKSDEIELECP